MPDVQLRLIVKCLGALTAGAWLSACSLLSTSNGASGQARQLTIASPIAGAVDMQNVTGFDVYVDGETLHAVFTATGGDAKLPLIGYLHSEDGGRHWSAPQEIGKPFALPVESKIGNDIQIAASGDQILVMWQTTGELPGMGPLVAIYSNDGGKTWQKGANPTGSDSAIAPALPYYAPSMALTDQSHHDLAADPQGRFHLVWLDDRDENGYQGLRYARSTDAGRHWEFAQTLDDSSCSCCWNRLSISADGQINALYRDMEPRDMALAQSADAGQTWQRLSTVGAFNWKFDGCPHNGGGLSQAENGPIHSVVWTGAENRAGLYHMQSADGGKNWRSPQAVAAGSGAFHGDIAALDENRVALIWDAMGPEGYTVLVADSADNGGIWSAPRQLSSPGVSASHPRIVATGSGWLALWTEQKSKTFRQWLSAVLQ